MRFAYSATNERIRFQYVFWRTRLISKPLQCSRAVGVDRSEFVVRPEKTVLLKGPKYRNTRPLIKNVVWQQLARWNPQSSSSAGLHLTFKRAADRRD